MTNFQHYMQKAVKEVYEGTDNEFYAICDYVEDCKKCPIHFKCAGIPDREEIAAWLREEYNNAKNDNIIRQSDNEKEAGEASGS